MKENWKNAIKMMKIDKSYHEASLDRCNLIPQKIIDYGKRWLAAPNRPNLYLHGNTGSGKSYFSVALFREMVEMNFNWLIYVKSYDLDDELLDSIETKQERSILQKYCEVPILFIDDLGAERPTERVARQYFKIIDSRTANKKLTIVNSNLPKNELPLGDRTISRLEYFMDIEFPKVDLRKQLELIEV